MDMKWMWGGARLQTCAIKHRVSFLLVKSSTVDLMNVWGPGYCWSAQWWSLVHYLNVEPSPHTSTSCSPDIIHVRGVPVFHRSTTSMYYTEHNRRTNSGGRPRNEAGKTEGYYRVNVVSHIIMWLRTEAFNRSISKTVSWYLLQLGTAWYSFLLQLWTTTILVVHCTTIKLYQAGAKFNISKIETVLLHSSSTWQYD